MRETVAGESRGRIAVRAGGFCLLASAAVAAAIVALGGGFGGDDIGAFFAWTLPFSAAIGALAAAEAPRLAGGPLRALGLVGLAAVVAAVAWTAAVGLLLAPFFLLFSFPVFPCWLAGGAAGLASVAGLGSAWRRTAVTTALVAPLLVFLATAALLALGPQRGDRDIDVVAYVRPDASAAEVAAFADARLSTAGGIEGVSPDYSENALYIEFSADATESERAEVVRRLEASPLVARLEFDVPPDETG